MIFIPFFARPFATGLCTLNPVHYLCSSAFHTYGCTVSFDEIFELAETDDVFSFCLFHFFLFGSTSFALSLETRSNATRDTLHPTPINSSCDISCKDKSTSSTSATQRNSPRIREKRQFKITGMCWQIFF